METLKGFVRTIIQPLTPGQVVEVLVQGRYITFEFAEWTSANTCNLLQLNSNLSGYIPVIPNAEISTAEAFTKLILTGGSDGGQISIISHENPCAGYYTPQPQVHPLSNVEGLQTLFIIDADFSYRNYPTGLPISRLIDCSGNGNHFDLYSGTAATKIAGGAAGTSTAHTINFPTKETGYRGPYSIMPTPDGVNLPLMVTALNGGSIIDSPDNNWEIYGQGNGDGTAEWRIDNTLNEARLVHRGATYAKDPTRTFNQDDIPSSGGFHVAYWLSYYTGGRVGHVVRWDELSTTENNYPGFSGITSIQPPGTYSTIGKGNRPTVNGIGNPDCRIGMIAGFLYNNPNYNSIPMQYAASKYGITLGP